MSHLNVKKLKDLNTIIKNNIVLLGQPNFVQEEIYHNMWAIDFSPKLIQTINIKDLVNFLTNLIEQRSLQITKEYPDLKATFYIWYDEQAGQLRFNILSGCNIKLPFGCNINIIQSPLPILQKFLSEMQNEHQPLNYENFQVFTADDPSWDELDDDNSEHILDVYIITLPEPNISNILKAIIE